MKLKAIISNNCVICKKEIPKEDMVCSKICAQKELFEILKKIKRLPTNKYLSDIKKMIHKGSIKLQSKQFEAFSFPEVIDKFVIVAIKSMYLTGEKLVTNKKDYIEMKKTVEDGLKEKPVENPSKLQELFDGLWDVNMEIFCLNDICGNYSDFRIVAASSKRMITMMIDRNLLKHKIANLIGDTVREVKQYGK